MNYRLAQIIPTESIAADKTWTVDISMEDPISQILIQYKTTNNGSTPTAHPAKCITSVELLDGSLVLQKLSGYQLQALDYWHGRRTPFQILNYVDNQNAVVLGTLHFGRKLWDPELAFLPSKFVNPQIRITIDLNAGGSAPDAGQLEVVAWCFDEKKVNPWGMLIAKEHYSYTLVASGTETISLPRDHPMKLLMIRSLGATLAPNEQYNTIRLSEDRQKRIILDDRTTDLIKYLVANREPVFEGLMGVANTTPVRHYITPAYEPHYGILPNDAAAAYMWTDIGDERGGVVDIDSSGATTMFKAHVSGHCPHGSLAIPFGDPDDPADWFDVRKLQDLELRLVAGSSASGTCDIVCQQLHRY